jgi:hypothetical protein
MVTSLNNRTSNGYLEYIFRRSARELFGIELNANENLQYVQGRNKDLKEVHLEINGVKILKFASAYGFRNI